MSKEIPNEEKDEVKAGEGTNPKEVFNGIENLANKINDYKNGKEADNKTSEKSNTDNSSNSGGKTPNGFEGTNNPNKQNAGDAGIKPGDIGGESMSAPNNKGGTVVKSPTSKADGEGAVNPGSSAATAEATKASAEATKETAEAVKAGAEVGEAAAEGAAEGTAVAPGYGTIIMAGVKALWASRKIIYKVAMCILMVILMIFGSIEAITDSIFAGAFDISESGELIGNEKKIAELYKELEDVAKDIAKEAGENRKKMIEEEISEKYSGYEEFCEINTDEMGNIQGELYRTLAIYNVYCKHYGIEPSKRHLREFLESKNFMAGYQEKPLRKIKNYKYELVNINRFPKYKNVVVGNLSGWAWDSIVLGSDRAVTFDEYIDFLNRNKLTSAGGNAQIYFAGLSNWSVELSNLGVINWIALSNDCLYVKTDEYEILCNEDYEVERPHYDEEMSPKEAEIYVKEDSNASVVLPKMELVNSIEVIQPENPEDINSNWIRKPVSIEGEPIYVRKFDFDSGKVKQYGYNETSTYEEKVLFAGEVGPAFDCARYTIDPFDTSIMEKCLEKVNESKDWLDEPCSFYGIENKSGEKIYDGDLTCGEAIDELTLAYAEMKNGTYFADGVSVLPNLPQKAKIEIKIVDNFGFPMINKGVTLYHQVGSEKTVVAFSKTDNTGIVTFENLTDTNSLHYIYEIQGVTGIKPVTPSQLSSYAPYSFPFYKNVASGEKIKCTSPFGPRVSPGGIGSTYHHGLDLVVLDRNGNSLTQGRPVYSYADGKVLESSLGYNGGFGGYIAVEHKSGEKTFITRYAHLSGVVVRAGDTVTQGQHIGYAGNTGNSTGPHLHFEINIDGNRVDPMPYVTEYIDYIRDVPNTH